MSVLQKGSLNWGKRHVTDKHHVYMCMSMSMCMSLCLFTYIYIYECITIPAYTQQHLPKCAAIIFAGAYCMTQRIIWSRESTIPVRYIQYIIQLNKQRARDDMFP